MPLGVATVLGASIREHPQQRDLMRIEQRDYAIIEQLRRGDRRLAVIQLGAGQLAVGVDKGLLVNSPHALHIANVEGILCATITWVLALELAVRFLLGLGL